VHNRVRGLHPWPHAFTTLKGRRVIVLRSAVTDAAADGQPGTVLLAHGDDLIVSTGSGTVKLLELQLEGRRPMRTREFLAGHPILPGERFTAP
jgi:methionyl-tRNA formyltransferase